MSISDISLTEIKYIPWGIACRVKNTIYLNEALKKYPELCNSLIEHEKKHSSSFTARDFKMDIHNAEISANKAEYWKFVSSTPSSWTEFLPFWFYDGRFVVNASIVMLYAVFLVIFLSIYFALT